MRTALSVVLLVTAVVLTGVSGAALAAPVDCQASSDLDSGDCTVSAGSSGSGARGLVVPASTGSGGGMCSFNGAPIPCTKDGGWWSASYGCYITGPIDAGEAQVAGLPGADGGDVVAAGDGFAYYRCASPDGPAGVLRLPVDAPPIPVDPEVVARLAVEQLNLQAIDIGIVPEPGPASVGLVGLPVWLWVDQPGAVTYGPVSTSATVGATTVTATAQVRELVWDMGDGATVTCTTPGTPYADRYGDSMSPDCGYRYTRTSAGQPGQVYQVTATSQWEVSWAGGGEAGVIPVTLSSSTPVRVGEAQVLVQ